MNNRGGYGSSAGGFQSGGGYSSPAGGYSSNQQGGYSSGPQFPAPSCPPGGYGLGNQQITYATSPVSFWSRPANYHNHHHHGHVVYEDSRCTLT